MIFVRVPCSENSKMQALIVNGRTLVPVRAVSEGLGAEVEWDDVYKQVIITLPEAE